MNLKLVCLIILSVSVMGCTVTKKTSVDEEGKMCTQCPLEKDSTAIIIKEELGKRQKFSPYPHPNAKIPGKEPYMSPITSGK